MELYYEGTEYDVYLCDGAAKSRKDALKKVSPAGKKKTLDIGIYLQIKRFANGDTLHSDHFCSEGNLPSHGGNTKKFYEFKRKPLRAYCWFSDKHEKKTVYISHFVYKDWQKLDARDTEKVINNWRKVEEG